MGTLYDHQCLLERQEQWVIPSFAPGSTVCVSFTETLRIAIFTAEDNVLTGDLFPPGFKDFADAEVSQDLPSENFCRALYDMYIGPATIVPDGRQQFAQGVLELLKS